jgi:peptidyl-prolyl cis-trans isomerase D|tara:strand:- start:2269 stop:3156 length:888 start_codon:yes stop_codon:yes gene_type:complete
MKIFNPHHWLRSVAVMVCITPLIAQAEVLSDWQGSPSEAVLASMQGQDITWAEVQLAIVNTSESDRQGFATDAEKFAAYIKTLVLRKYIINEAEKAELDDSESVGFVLRQAYDQAMIDGWLSLEAQPGIGIPSPEAVTEAYQTNQEQFTTSAKVSLSQIFLQNTEDKEADALRLSKVLDEIVANPSNFSELSKTYSDHTESANNGGSLGWLEINKLQPVIFEAIADLQRGEISRPVTTDIGSHFLLVNDISSAKITPLEDVQDAIIVSLRKKWKAAKQQELIAQLMTLVKVNSAD